MKKTIPICLLLFPPFGMLLATSFSGQMAPLKTNAIQLFEVTKQQFVIRGSNLARVEIRAYSTGTGITESTLLGEAKRVTDAGKEEVWTMPLPSAPEEDYLVSQIFAVGNNAKGEMVGQQQLNCHGALIVGTAPAWCGKWIGDDDAGGNFSYFLGQEFDVWLPLDKYPQDELAITCTPDGVLKPAPLVEGQEYDGVYVLRYEAVKEGKCTITDRSFNASLAVVQIPHR